MADPIISVVVDKLADFLLKQAKEEIDMLTGVEREAENLVNTLKMIQAVLADAEQRMIWDQTVKAWLHDLEDLSYEIDDVLDEWNYMILKQQIEGSSNVNDDASHSIGRQLRVCSFIPSSCFCFNKVFVRRDVAKKIKDLNERLDLIEKRKNQFGFITSIGVAPDSKEWKRVQSTSIIDVSEVCGRVSDKDTLISQLLSSGHQEGKNVTQVLSIVGTGGIGKTTLAQLAYNDDQVKGYFEQKAWVCVSSPFEEIRIAKAILQSLESSSPNLDELEPLLNRIKDSISGKRIFFVFDDAWSEEEMKWEPFKNVVKYGAPGSTILLTTRSERVARVVGAHIISLGVLSDFDSWSLFRQIAFFGRTKNECERLEDIGREITRKCKGLPLAIKTMASLLRFKNNVEKWQRVVNSNTWELEVAEVELFPHLYLSYNDLSPQVRRCFTYCAVFPKDKEINVDDLIRMWMAQGYLKSSGSQGEMELEGREIFESLALHSFFQDFKFEEIDKRIFSCKMHDIVHDFAQYLSKRECLMIEGKRKVSVCENARHITWLGSKEITDTFLKGNFRIPRSLFASELTLVRDLLNSLKLVRVLRLDSCDLKELQMEIGNLIHLRYLRMYKCQLRELPRTIYDLYNLQTLYIEDCSDLLELPPGIEKLAKLRHLNFHNKYPVGIEKLTCLQTLGYFSIGRGFNKCGYLKNLNQLHGKISIWIRENLEDATDITECRNANLKSKVHIQSLALGFELGKGIRVKEEVMKALEPPPNLQSIVFFGYGETRLPTWMTTSLNNLRRLDIFYCSRLTSLPPLGILPSLEQLLIFCLDELKMVDLSFFGLRVIPDLEDVQQHATLLSPIIGFPKLIELKMEWCPKLAEWEDIGGLEDEVDAIPILPCLRRLIIVGCLKLRIVPHRLLRMASSLDYIEFDDKTYDRSAILSFLAEQEEAAQKSTEETP